MGNGRDFLAANDYALNIIDDTLYDFTAENRPPVLRGNIGRVLGQFQFFRLHTIGKIMQLFKDSYGAEYTKAVAAAGGDQAKLAEAKRTLQESRKELAFTMGMSFTLAGAGGTPLAMAVSNTFTNAVWEAIKLLFGDPDDPWDPAQDFKQGLREAVGQEGETLFSKGFVGLLGADISKRVGMGGLAEIVSGDPPPGLSGTQRANWYAGRLLGPSYGMVTDTMRAFNYAANGELGKAMVVSSPKFVKDFSKAVNAATDGVKTSSGRVLLEDVSPVGLALMLSGINPTEVALAQEESREIANLSTTLQKRRSFILNQYADAVASDDYEAKEEALEKINAWGESQPRLRITGRELIGAVRRGRDKAVNKLSKREEIIKEELGR